MLLIYWVIQCCRGPAAALKNMDYSGLSAKMVPDIPPLAASSHHSSTRGRVYFLSLSAGLPWDLL